MQTRVYQCYNTTMMDRVRQFRSWFARHKHRIGLVVVGHTAKRIEEYLFDWLIYGVVVFWSTSQWGPLYGSLVAFLIMAPISALFCWLYILFYDWAKIDWLGFEALKELKEVETTGLFGRLFRHVVRFGDAPVFILLSMYGDPFMVTIYFRKRENAHGGLTRRDWKIFWAAVVFSNAYWTLRWAVIVVLAQFVWTTFLEPFFFSSPGILS